MQSLRLKRAAANIELGIALFLYSMFIYHHMTLLAKKAIACQCETVAKI